jgi:hypothetical protein
MLGSHDYSLYTMCQVYRDISQEDTLRRTWHVSTQESRHGMLEVLRIRLPLIESGTGGASIISGFDPLFMDVVA